LSGQKDTDKTINGWDSPFPPANKTKITNPIDILKRSIDNFQGYKEFNKERFFKFGIEMMLKGTYTRGLPFVPITKFDISQRKYNEEIKIKEVSDEIKKKKLIDKKVRLYELRMVF
jgi:hypothetical protein